MTGESAQSHNARSKADRDVIEDTNTKVERLIGWIDRLLPFSARRPLDRIPSLKLKLTIVIGAAIAATGLTLTIANWLGSHPAWGLALGVLAAIIGVQFLARGITVPLREMRHATSRMARGDYSQVVDASSADEVGELARSFNTMAAGLAAMDSQRREMIANVSHELRTPITAMRGSIENLIDGVTPASPETLATVLRQLQRLELLVEQLLDLSRLEAGVSPMRVEQVDLMEVVAEAADEAGARNPTPVIKIDGPAELTLNADPGRLHQVLLNLLDNAIRFGPVNHPIEIHVGADDKWANVEVTDRGPGIPAGEVQRIFERFHRSGDARGDGFGLGLAIAREVVEQHNGRISARNLDTGGCAIEFRLPLPL